MGAIDLPPRVATGVSLWPKTTVRAGGKASYYAEPESVDALRVQLAWAEAEPLPVVILGGGSNVLFRGDLPGLVIHTRLLRGLSLRENILVAGAGESLSGVAWAACRRGFGGLEWACGIPGTVGGAVAMNAGAYGGDIASVLRSIEWVEAGESRQIPASDLSLGYRTSAVRTGALRGAIASALFALQEDEAAACLERAREVLSQRASRLPAGASFGCVFRNPPTGPTAGELLDRAGCKGFRVGAVRVSDVHANVLVNEGSGNSAEVLELIERMKRRVMERFGVVLHEEVVVY